MTGGSALGEMLARHEVDTIFALPGMHNDALFAPSTTPARRFRRHNRLPGPLPAGLLLG
jgi:thiamine pyrophosphate-dependent acetolactate synthase large subunit-like protein